MNSPRTSIYNGSFVKIIYGRNEKQGRNTCWIQDPRRIIGRLVPGRRKHPCEGIRRRCCGYSVSSGQQKSKLTHYPRLTGI